MAMSTMATMRTRACGSLWLLARSVGQCRRRGGQDRFDREPAVVPRAEAAFERPDSRDPPPSQRQRHPGARRFVWSGAVENDVPIPRDVVMLLLQLLGGDPQRAVNQEWRRGSFEL